MIEFVDVTKTYEGGARGLENVSLKVDKGEFVFVVGQSGAGKSTLIKLIMREFLPTSGSVIVAGKDTARLKNSEIPYFRRNLGVVFQDFRLIPTMTVYENVAFALHVTGVASRQIKKRVFYILELVDLLDKAKRMPEHLSGGEQQRVALARALVNNPQIIVADEPTGNIDPEMSFEIVDLLNEINKLGTTVVMVTHQHNLVTRFNHRTLVIDQGILVADGRIGGRRAYR
jgi:cell division transport system ATP-binding protein